MLIQFTLEQALEVKQMISEKNEKRLAELELQVADCIIEQLLQERK